LTQPSLFGPVGPNGFLLAIKGVLQTIKKPSINRKQRICRNSTATRRTAPAERQEKEKEIYDLLTNPTQPGTARTLPDEEGIQREVIEKWRQPGQ
jgi:hypothetical protein